MINNKDLFIIAEISANHNGKIEHAYSLIDYAKVAGADAVKIQYYQPGDMCVQEGYTIKGGTPWDNRYLHSLYNQGCMPKEWLAPLFRYAKSRDIILFSSVFSLQGIKDLEEVNCPIYKIASFENEWDDLIWACISTAKPVIISMGTFNHIQRQICFNKFHTSNSIFMYCTSAYPTNTNEVNIENINNVDKRLIIGFSDHTKSGHAAMAAVARGATVIEKHMMAPGERESLDKDFSLDPHQFREYVYNLKEVKKSLVATYDPEGPYKQFKRSIYAIKDISVGESFTRENTAVLRPALGLHPSEYNNLLTRKASHFILANFPIKKEHISE